MLRSVNRELRRRWPVSQHVVTLARTTHYPTSLHSRRSSSTFDSIESAILNGRRGQNGQPSKAELGAELRKQLKRDQDSENITGQTTHRIEAAMLKRRTEVDRASLDSNSRRNLVNERKDRGIERLEFLPNYLRHRIERRLKMQKGWADQSPATLLRRYLAIDDPEPGIQIKVASIRSMRLPIILMQMHIRRQLAADPTGMEGIAEALPSESQWQRLMGIMEHNGHTEECLSRYVDILFARTDEERCHLFMADSNAKPTFIFNYLLRLGSGISEISTLDKLLSYFKERLKTTAEKKRVLSVQSYSQGRARTQMQRFSTQEAMENIERLAFHCRRIEPRRLVVLAEIIAEFIVDLGANSHGPSESFPTDDTPAEAYHAQCKFFNAALSTIASRTGSGAEHKTIPYAYIWAAQRVLLAMSDSLPQTLAVDRSGFQAIRAVLAGMPKNRDELHAASRHSETWPPYLAPADGIDEAMDAEESWSRVVRAGMMMQEAGFPKQEVDEVIDILYGLAPDGSPTIQQRMQINMDRKMSAWAASIRATRNAHEAWQRFNNPPEPGMRPGVLEYAAMFQRLYARDADPQRSTVPGDNHLNQPMNRETNLTELEKLRLQPPTPEELYSMMREAGIRPDDQCLRILVSNAGTLAEAHRYLEDGTTARKKYAELTTAFPSTKLLRKIPLPLFSAYMELLSKTPNLGGRNLLRAVQLAERRLSGRNANWSSFVWVPILKELGQRHERLRLTLEAQLRLLLYVTDHIDAEKSINLVIVDQLAKTLRKILRREVENLAASLSTGNADKSSLALHYQSQATHAGKNNKHIKSVQEPMTLSIFRIIGERMTGLFYAAAVKEKHTSRPKDSLHVSHVDMMRARKDPVMPHVAHNLMLALAFTGQFRAMSDLMKWLIQEWSLPVLQEEIQSMGELPQDLDMIETLCAFRAFAEPLVRPRKVEQVMHGVMENVIWEWPDDAVVEKYIESYGNGIKELRDVVIWARDRFLYHRNNDFTDVHDLNLDWTKTQEMNLKVQLDTTNELRRRVFATKDDELIDEDETDEETETMEWEAADDSEEKTKRDEAM
ncbi:prefoldin subunit [Fusarium longipes]|uniref:Prefoldin subunit n=1 Tax=Fusarium longipes TaxID=694270 RepID=A0A395SCE4_9HYPO|nr:prefoldin subunit [Fusarium longipes]